MRLIGMLTILALSLAAQVSSVCDPNETRGRLLRWDAEQSRGELTVRSANGDVLVLRFDERTEFEVENRRITAAALRKGDDLAISAEGSGPGRLGYARVVKVVEAPAPSAGQTAISRNLRPCHGPLEDTLFQADGVGLSGVVCCMAAGRLSLRTRNQGEKTLLLRDDTWYLKNGKQVKPSVLTPNTHVFVRARRNLDYDLEACQVIWGDILKVAP